MLLRDILKSLKHFYGEENISYKKRVACNFMTIYYKKKRFMFLIKSYCGGWVCLFDFEPKNVSLEPFLITKDLNKFEEYLEYVMCEVFKDFRNPSLALASA